MNVEFHYYSTAFLAVKAGFSPQDATTLAYSSQYVDNHHRSLEIQTRQGLVNSRPTQNFSFWDQATVTDILAPFHFFPAGIEGGAGQVSVRTDGKTSAWEVRPNSPPAKRLLVDALRTRNLYRIGIALHTFADTWAHQNFTARNEVWNRLDEANSLPSPGHAHAGRLPDLWLETWTDTRLLHPVVINFERFLQAAGKIYRYLCTFCGKDFHSDETRVLEELSELIEAGRGRDRSEDRMLEFILALDLAPYDAALWPSQALEQESQSSDKPTLDHWKRAGQELLHKVGLSSSQSVIAKSGFEKTPFSAWIHAAEEQRKAAKDLIRETTGEDS